MKHKTSHIGLIANTKRCAAFFIALALLFTTACSQVKNTASSVGNRVGDAASNAGEFAGQTIDTAQEFISDAITRITTPKTADEYEKLIKGVTAQHIAALVTALKEIDFVDVINRVDDVARQFNLQYVAVSEIEDAINAELANLKTIDPAHILGSSSQKHGEIAEIFDVALHNIERIKNGLVPDATLDTVGRTAPQDYIINGKNYQSKFYNGPRATLDAVLKSIDDYGDANDFFCIPKDQYDVLIQVKNDPRQVAEILYNDGRLTSGTMKTLSDKIAEIEASTGKAFEEVVTPSKLSYKEAVEISNNLQTSNSSAYTDELEKTLNNEVQQQRNVISELEADAKNTIFADTVNELSQSTLKAAAIGGSIEALISCGFSVYEKVNSGKTIETLTEEDWKDIGFDTLFGFGHGAVDGAATNILLFCGVPAPLAAAVVSAIIQAVMLNLDFQKGLYTEDEYISNVLTIFTDSAFIAIGSLIGQMIIPIPVVGLIVGSVATNAILSVVKGFAISQRIKDRVDAFAVEFVDNFNRVVNTASSAVKETGENVGASVADAYSDVIGFTAQAIEKVKGAA